MLMLVLAVSQSEPPQYLTLSLFQRATVPETTPAAHLRYRPASLAQ